MYLVRIKFFGLGKQGFPVVGVITDHFTCAWCYQWYDRAWYGENTDQRGKIRLKFVDYQLFLSVEFTLIMKFDFSAQQKLAVVQFL